jgi:hypothetical protein
VEKLCEWAGKACASVVEKRRLSAGWTTGNPARNPVDRSPDSLCKTCGQLVEIRRTSLWTA